MPNSFEEASRATEALFAEDEDNGQTNEQMSEVVEQEKATPTEEAQSEELAQQEEVIEEEQIAQQEQAAMDGAMLEQATETAEIAASVAAQKEDELRQVMAEVEGLRRQNEQLQGAMAELSRQNEENLIEDILEPPVLDVSSLAFADEETIKQAQAQYAQAMTDYNRKQIMKEIEPALEYAKRGMRDAEKAEVLSVLSQIPDLQNIQQMLPQLDRIIANNKWLSSDDMPMDEKYITAYAMAKGINSINNPPEPPEEPKDPTVDELMELYNKYPEFQEMVERQRIDQIKNSQQVPPMSASSGAVNAALDIKEEPKGWDDASERTRKMFGLS